MTELASDLAKEAEYKEQKKIEESIMKQKKSND
jgi:hypothetical protein